MNNKKRKYYLEKLNGSKHKNPFTNWRAKNEYKINIFEYIELTKKCYFCNWTIGIHLHHVISKQDGGENKYNNYIGLCPNHHKLIHSKLKYPTEYIEMMKDFNIENSKNKYKTILDYY